MSECSIRRVGLDARARDSQRMRGFKVRAVTEEEQKRVGCADRLDACKQGVPELWHGEAPRVRLGDVVDRAVGHYVLPEWPRGKCRGKCVCMYVITQQANAVGFAKTKVATKVQRGRCTT